MIKVRQKNIVSELQNSVDKLEDDNLFLRAKVVELAQKIRGLEDRINYIEVLATNNDLKFH